MSEEEAPARRSDAVLGEVARVQAFRQLVCEGTYTCAESLLSLNFDVEHLPARFIGLERAKRTEGGGDGGVCACAGGGGKVLCYFRNVLVTS